MRQETHSQCIADDGSDTSYLFSLKKKEKKRKGLDPKKKRRIYYILVVHLFGCMRRVEEVVLTLVCTLECNLSLP